jgi:hypothetical protein
MSAAVAAAVEVEDYRVEPYEPTVTIGEGTARRSYQARGDQLVGDGVLRAIESKGYHVSTHCMRDYIEMHAVPR